jgi:hypothetical protein
MRRTNQSINAFSINKLQKPQFGPRLVSQLKVMLFTNARDESHIKEWACHHLLLGFDIVYIFDHKSLSPIKNEFVNFKNRVVVERCEMELPVKLPLMQRAANIAKSAGAHWFIYLDADEFLILNSYPNVKRMIMNFPFAQSIALNWLYFGTNFHVKEPPGLILENYTKSELFLDKHVKTFVKTRFVASSENPHYYRMHKGCRLLSINRQLMNESSLALNYNNMIEYSKTPAYIAHYAIQSEETYIKRKINLPADDGSGVREKCQNVHEYGDFNKYENTGPLNKYASRVKEFIQKIG